MKLLLTIFLTIISWPSKAQAPLVFTKFGEPGKKLSSPYNFCIYHDLMFFSATEDSTGQELWVCDGTKEGLHLFKDLLPGTGSSEATPIAVVNDRLLFKTNIDFSHIDLWATNGSSNSIIHIATIDRKNYFNFQLNQWIVYHDKLLFFAINPADSSALTLWTSDGTAAGTYPIDSMVNYTFDQVTPSFTIYNDKVYFLAGSDGGEGHIFVTQENKASTKAIKTIPISSNTRLSVAGGKMYFFAYDGQSFQNVPWVSDGSTQGTEILNSNSGKAIQQYSSNNFVTYKDYVYFVGAVDSQCSLYRTDGTNTGTSILKKGYVTQLVNKPIMNRLLFCINDTMYASNGEETGTWPLKDVNARKLAWSNVLEYENKIFIRSILNSFCHYFMAWDLDSSIVPIEKKPSFPSDNSLNAIVYKNAIWLSENLDSTYTGLWRIDDTTTVTQQPTQPFAIYPNPNHGSFTISTADSNFIGRIHICDAAGREVYYNNHVSGATIQVTIPGAATGVYFLTMQDLSDPKASRTISSYKIVVW